MFRFRLALLGVVSVLAWMPVAASARIKLITLPVRERVEVQLENDEATLVEEERIVPLVKGLNQVDFSWANTQIDPSTIVFRVLGATEGRDLDPQVLSVSYPPNESALVWSVASRDAGSARVRISYLLGNLTRSFHYRAVASHDERTLSLAQFLRLQNFSNEAYASSGVWAGFGTHFLKPIGLNQTREMLAARHNDVPIRKTYTCDAAGLGYLDAAQRKLNVPMHYVLKNDAANQLGKGALPFGKVRIFQDDGRGSTAFLGEDWGRFTPQGDEMALFLGLARDVVVKRTIERNDRERVAGNLYHQDIVLKFEIENFKDQPVTLDVIEQVRALRTEVLGDTGRDVQWELGPETTFPGGLDTERTTLQAAVLRAPLPPRSADGKAEVIVHKLHLRIRNEW